MSAGSSGASVSVPGLGRLQRELRQLGAGLDDLKDANARAASIVATEAATRAPRRSGRLAGSGRGNRAAGRATVTFGGAAVPYAAPVHYGWPARNIDPHPFVLDAAEATRADWLGAYEDDLQELVDRVGGTY